MKTNTPYIIATGGWKTGHPCPVSATKKHSFREIASKPGRKAIGERLVTSRCVHCGGTIVDCPTIFA